MLTTNVVEVGLSVLTENWWPMSLSLRHHEHVYLSSNIEKLPLPILGNMRTFWNPTGLVRQFKLAPKGI